MKFWHSLVSIKHTFWACDSFLRDYLDSDSGEFFTNYSIAVHTRRQTYGYTSAAYSGRMPCVDIADSIVGVC